MYLKCLKYLLPKHNKPESDTTKITDIKYKLIAKVNEPTTISWTIKFKKKPNVQYIFWAFKYTCGRSKQVELPNCWLRYLKKGLWLFNLIPYKKEGIRLRREVVFKKPGLHIVSVGCGMYSYISGYFVDSYVNLPVIVI